jgi:phage terminase large subunit-like protein
MDKWDLGAEPKPFADYEGKSAVLGVDLSNVNDLSALVVAFRETTDVAEPLRVTGAVGDDEYSNKDINIDFKVTCFCRFYMPEEALLDHERTDKLPYSLWRDQGWLTVTKGATVDYTQIYRDIIGISKLCKVVDIGLDPYNANWIAKKLTESAELPVTMVRQSVQSLSEPEQILEALVLSGRLFHSGNPILRNHASNAVVTRDLKDNILAKKPSAYKRIDGVIALAIGLSRLLAQPEQEIGSVYDNPAGEPVWLDVD